MRELFAADPERGIRWTVSAAGLYLDYSKNRIDDETVVLLAALARHSGLQERITAMFAGEVINTTEQRAVLHTALRAPPSERLWVDGIDVVAEVQAVLARIGHPQRAGSQWRLAWPPHHNRPSRRRTSRHRSSCVRSGHE